MGKIKEFLRFQTFIVSLQYHTYRYRFPLFFFFKYEHEHEVSYENKYIE